MIDSFVAAKNNPFAVERVTQIPYRFHTGDWDLHLNRLSRLGFRGAIVGPQGTGKSTLLSELLHQLESRDHAAHLMFLPKDIRLHGPVLEDSFDRMNAGGMLLVDGIERLTFYNRERLYFRSRNANGFVATVHQTCRLPTWIESSSNVHTLDHVLRYLNLDQPAIQQESWLQFELQQGNIRSVLRELYDQFSKGRFGE